MWATEDQLLIARNVALFIIIVEAVHFIHMKLLVEQAFPHRFAFHSKAFKTFHKFRIC